MTDKASGQRLSADEWRRIGAVLDRVNTADPSDRARALAEACREEDLSPDDVGPYLEAERAGGNLPEQLDPQVLSGAFRTFTGEGAIPPLPPGTRIGSYEILAELASGGMGEVYRARDTRLGRIVALKRLNADLAARPDARVRFEREARAISRLSHPHICTLFDVITEDGTDFLVMELVDGETLAARLERGPLSVDETVRLSVHICAGLAAAHRQNVVHRDLKPANVMLTSHGVKLLDFGLAALRGDDSTGDDPHVTATGVIMGTPAYMAPEQLKGQPVDARADIFALGAVMHEMLAGQRAFTGSSSAEIAASILEREPEPLSQFRDDVPHGVAWTIRTCLAKNPDERWQNAADVARQLQWVAASSGAPTHELSATASRKPLAWIAAALLISVAAVAAFAWAVSRNTPADADAPLARFALTPPPGHSFDRMHALSPEASQIAFVTVDDDARRMLWTRAIDSLRAQRLPGTEDASYPFWSPDGKFIGFFARDALKKVELATGTVETICNCQTGTGGGGTWNREGVILFSKGLVPSPLWQVAASGGTAVAITPSVSRDGDKLRDTNVWPHFLPDGKHFLWMAGGKPGEIGLFVRPLGSDERKRLIEFRRGLQPTGVASRTRGWYHGGYLFFVQQQELMAQPFSLERLELTGDPVRIVEQVAQTAPGRSVFDVARGVLAYREPQDERAVSRLVWLDRSGRELATIGSPVPAGGIALSRDGRHVLTHSRSAGVVRIDVTSGIPTPLGYQGGSPVWSPDGKRLSLAGGSVAAPLTSIGSVDAPEDIKPLKLPGTGQAWPTDWSNDGRLLVGQVLHADTGFDLWAADIGSEPPAIRYLHRTPGNQLDQRISPDGRWIAFASDERSDTYEVYVRPFPEGSGVSRISTAGGRLPTWTANGRELLYVAPDGSLMSAAVKVEGEFSAGPPHPLFRREELRRSFQQEPGNRRYDLLDERRILLVAPVNRPEPPPIVIVLNWERLLPKTNPADK
jgi:serine/threonine protein kinase